MRVILAALGLLVITSTSSWAEVTVDKAHLQAAMQRHIERHLVDGAFLHFDTSTGEVRSLYPTQAHPMVITLGDHFVLCTDLRDKSGKTMPLDLYMARSGRSFIVFHSEVDNRDVLQQLLRKGVARRLR